MLLNDKRIFEVKPTSLAYQVAELLSRAILEGDLKGGEQLTELVLQEHLGISRSPLREAFRELEKKGLVEIIPRKGTFVKSIKRKDIEENFPVRAELEGLAARMAALNMNDVVLEELQLLVNQMEKAVQTGETKAYYDAHLQFHETFIECSDNLLLINLLKNLRMHSMWQRFSFQYYQEDLAKAFEVHREILSLFRESEPDPEKVGNLVRQHINVALDRFLVYLEVTTPKAETEVDHQ